MKPKMNKLVGMLAGVSLLAMRDWAAQADPMFTTDFTIDHCTGTCGPAGTIFGSITLTDTAFGVDFDVKVLNGMPLTLTATG